MLFVAPVREKNFVQQFQTGGEPRRDFVTGPKYLLQLAGAFRPSFSLPDRFQRGIVSQNERPKIFLRDEFRFQFENSIADSYFLISRQADRIDHWVGEV